MPPRVIKRLATEYQHWHALQPATRRLWAILTEVEVLRWFAVGLVLSRIGLLVSLKRVVSLSGSRYNLPVPTL